MSLKGGQGLQYARQIGALDLKGLGGGVSGERVRIEIRPGHRFRLAHSTTTLQQVSKS
jgi:hypothetical protein